MTTIKSGCYAKKNIYLAHKFRVHLISAGLGWSCPASFEHLQLAVGGVGGCAMLAELAHVSVVSSLVTDVLTGVIGATGLHFTSQQASLVCSKAMTEERKLKQNVKAFFFQPSASIR